MASLWYRAAGCAHKLASPDLTLATVECRCNPENFVGTLQRRFLRCGFPEGGSTPVDVPVAVSPGNSCKVMPKVVCAAEFGWDYPCAAGVNISPLAVNAHR